MKNIYANRYLASFNEFDTKDVEIANLALSVAGINKDWRIEVIPFSNDEGVFAKTLALVNRHSDRLFKHCLTGHTIHIIKATTSVNKKGAFKEHLERTSKTTYLCHFPVLEEGDDSVGLASEFVSDIDEVLYCAKEVSNIRLDASKSMLKAMSSAIAWIIEQEVSQILLNCDLPESLGGEL